jgi:2,3-diketo-5-methylthio-1-phosphopentane phosphatase
MIWNIFCDFDGTIALGDVVDTLLDRFAAPAWREIELAWKSGVIGSRECLVRQVALLDMPRIALDRCLDKIAIDADFPSFVAEARAQGHAITVVSDGLDYAIRRVLTRNGLADLPVISNSLQQRSERAWRIAFPHVDARCFAASGHCKCTTVRKTRCRATSNSRSLLIGDGTSDFCAAQMVDFVFAKDKLAEHHIQRNLPHCPIRSFADARRLMGMLDRIEPIDMSICV